MQNSLEKSFWHPLITFNYVLEICFYFVSLCASSDTNLSIFSYFYWSRFVANFSLSLPCFLLTWSFHYFMISDRFILLQWKSWILKTGVGRYLVCTIEWKRHFRGGVSINFWSYFMTCPCAFIHCWWIDGDIFLKELKFREKSKFKWIRRTRGRFYDDDIKKCQLT